MPKIKIGVFDSGKGGLYVASAIRSELPELEVIYKDDAEHVPYGDKSVEELHRLATPILRTFVDEGCRVIVIACNTLTTNLIERLRKELPVPLIGMEPAVKPAAADSKTKIIAVCATPRTLSSKRYAWLKQEYAQSVKVLEPDCSDWGLMIEQDRLERDKIAKVINEICGAGADQIVLGCTHYHGIAPLIEEIAAGRAAVIQPETPVIAQLKRVLAQLP